MWKESVGGKLQAEQDLRVEALSGIFVRNLQADSLSGDLRTGIFDQESSIRRLRTGNLIVRGQAVNHRTPFRRREVSFGN